MMPEGECIHKLLGKARLHGHVTSNTYVILSTAHAAGNVWLHPIYRVTLVVFDCGLTFMMFIETIIMQTSYFKPTIKCNKYHYKHSEAICKLD